MLLRPIRYLKAVADHRSFTRAASALHVSQPALSQQIREFEERMGVQMLDRSGRQVRPTDAGEVYLRHVRRALDELEVGGRAIRDVQDLSSGTLRLGFTPSFAIYLLAPLIRRYRDRFPGIVAIRATDPTTQARAALLQAIKLAYGDQPRAAAEMIRDAAVGLIIPRGKELKDGKGCPYLRNLKDAIEGYVGGGKWPSAQHLGRKFNCDQDAITDNLVLRAAYDSHRKVND